MPIELDDTTINIIDGADIYQVDFVKSKGYYNDINNQNIEYLAQWTYSSSDASVYHLGNVGIGTYPSNTKILNIDNGINIIGDLYINNILVNTPKYKHYTLTYSNRYLPDVSPKLIPYNLPNNNEYQIYTFVYNSLNDNGARQTQYTINFNEPTECDILIVAGGGGGGYDRAGGGGAGGLIFKSQILNGYYTILVGDGGNGSTNSSSNGANGYNSSIINNNVNINYLLNEVAIGGGGGGSYRVGSDGGSGGGSHGALTTNIPGKSLSGQGKNGGVGSGGTNQNSGGGGGAGGLGGNGLSGLSPENSGNGGIGFDFSSYYGITSGDGGWFAGGGGGSIAFDNTTEATKTTSSRGGRGGGGNAGLGRGQHGSPGLPNTGGGGGGGANINQGNGGKGGSGVVLIRCKLSNTDFNIPFISDGVTNNFNEFEQTNTLTFGYNENYLRYDYYPELTTFNDTANLIAWYKFDADPTNGAILTNYGIGGSLYNATLNIVNNGIERLSGFNTQYRYYWKSDAAHGNFISIPNTLIGQLNNNGHTICFWTKDVSVSDNDLVLLATKSGRNDRYIRINSPWSDNMIYYDSGNSSSTSSYLRASNASGISNNELVFWCFSRKNISSTQNELIIYKNGNKIHSIIGTRYDYNNLSLSDIFAIGYNMPSTDVDFVFKNKSLEDFRIYNKALRPEEIENLHLEFTYNKLLAHYKFNEFTNLGKDSSINSYNANVYGTPQHISPDTISFDIGNGTQYLLFPTDVIKNNGLTREELTFSIWVNKKVSNTGYVTYFSIDDNTTTDLSKTIFFGQSSVGSTYIHFRYGLSTVDLNTAYDNRTIDVWNHYSFVLRKDGNNANIKFYVNGIEYIAFNSNVAWLELHNYLKINRWQAGIHNDNINKYIRDFRIYNTALSACQIRYIYKSSSHVYNQSKYTLQFDRDTECDILVVAGGGGGCGNNIYRAGGGGGSGELLEKYNLTFTADTLYTIIVGNGGKGQPNKFAPAIEGYDSGIYTGTNGVIPFYHSRGGGRGGGGYYTGDLIFEATSGGSGGGASMLYDGTKYINYNYGLSIKYNTDGRGHDGKMSVNLDAGSGGGAGSIGEYSSSSLGQAQSLPGKGYTSYITDNAVTYASGGYGGWQYSRNTANAGKGSGGWGWGGPGGQLSYPGGNGIDGIVIIKYKYITSTSDSNVICTMNSWTYTNYSSVYYSGNVGIGISNPRNKLDVNGDISATTKSFSIQHPLNNKMNLYHGNIECPRYDNFYRGRAVIVNGNCIVNIDKECNDTGGLIEGTFDALNTDSQLYLQNNQTFDNVKGYIENGKIYIECENTEDVININWIVIAERKDTDVIKLYNTNINGKLICEHFK